MYSRVKVVPRSAPPSPTPCFVSRHEAVGGRSGRVAHAFLAPEFRVTLRANFAPRGVAAFLDVLFVYSSHGTFYLGKSNFRVDYSKYALDKKRTRVDKLVKWCIRSSGRCRTVVL